MRINLNMGVPASVAATTPNQGKSGESTAARSHAAATDSAQLSGRITPEALQAALNQLPETRSERISALTERVRNGSYQADSALTADAIVSHMSAARSA